MTSTTRRVLLTATAVGAVVAPVLVAPEVYAAATTRRDLYTRNRFTALRRRTFRVEGPVRSWRMKLTEVGNVQGVAKRDQHSFSLAFKVGSVGPEQGSYVLRRPGFKSTTLFLVPRGTDRRTYDAVIYRKP